MSCGGNCKCGGNCRCEKAVLTGASTGATMEGLDLALGAEEGEPCPNCSCPHENIEMKDSSNQGNMYWITVECLDCGLEGGSYTEEFEWDGEGILQASPQIAYNMGNPNFGALKCSRCRQRFEMAAESFEATTPCPARVWDNGYLVVCGWWNERNEPCPYHPDGKGIYDAESFSAEEICKTYICYTEMGGVGKDSDAKRGKKLLTLMGATNIRIRQNPKKHEGLLIGSDIPDDWMGMVRITFDYCAVKSKNTRSKVQNKIEWIADKRNPIHMGKRWAWNNNPKNDDDWIFADLDYLARTLEEKKDSHSAESRCNCTKEQMDEQVKKGLPLFHNKNDPFHDPERSVYSIINEMCAICGNKRDSWRVYHDRHYDAESFAADEGCQDCKESFRMPLFDILGNMVILESQWMGDANNEDTYFFTLKDCVVGSQGENWLKKATPKLQSIMKDYNLQGTLELGNGHHIWIIPFERNAESHDFSQKSAESFSSKLARYGDGKRVINKKTQNKGVMKVTERKVMRGGIDWGIKTSYEVYYDKGTHYYTDNFTTLIRNFTPLDDEKNAESFAADESNAYQIITTDWKSSMEPKDRYNNDKWFITGDISFATPDSSGNYGRGVETISLISTFGEGLTKETAKEDAINRATLYLYHDVIGYKNAESFAADWQTNDKFWNMLYEEHEYLFDEDGMVDYPMEQLAEIAKDMGFEAEHNQTRVYRNLGIGAALVAGLAYWFKR